MKKLLRRPLFVLPIAVIAFLFLAGTFSGCDFFGTTDDDSTGTTDDPIAVEGTWIYLGGEYSTRLEISDNTIKWYSGNESEIATTDNLTQECEIHSYNNQSFNAGESGNGDHGFAVIYYSNPSTYIESEAKDKYGILRWENLDSSSMDYSEGYYDPDGGFTPEYFDSPDEAKEKMTTADAFSSGYSTAEKQ